MTLQTHELTSSSETLTYPYLPAGLPDNRWMALDLISSGAITKLQYFASRGLTTIVRINSDETTAGLLAFSPAKIPEDDSQYSADMVTAPLRGYAPELEVPLELFAGHSRPIYFYLRIAGKYCRCIIVGAYPGIQHLPFVVLNLDVQMDGTTNFGTQAESRWECSNQSAR